MKTFKFLRILFLALISLSIISCPNNNEDDDVEAAKKRFYNIRDKIEWLEENDGDYNAPVVEEELTETEQKARAYDILMGVSE